MRCQSVWRITVATTKEAEEAVANILAEIFAVPASTTFDVLRNRTSVSIFTPRLPSNYRARLSVLRAKLREIARCGLQAGLARVSIRRLPTADWAESWKRHFKPIEISRSLLIKPSWSRRMARPGQAVVVLDPGLSFGTGQHATTKFCLQELACRRWSETQQSLLDAGTGSGILAISAAKLGYAPVDAFDLDPDAVRVARTNSRRNRVAGKLRIECRDLTTIRTNLGRRYDLVCANLLSTLLIAEQRRLVKLLNHDGVLVLAGILRTEFAQVQAAYEALGFRLLASRCEKEWRSGSFGLPRPPAETPSGFRS